MVSPRRDALSFFDSVGVTFEERRAPSPHDPGYALPWKHQQIPADTKTNPPIPIHKIGSESSSSGEDSVKVAFDEIGDGGVDGGGGD